MNNTQKTAAQFWQDATPRFVRKIYAAAGLKFNESVLFCPVDFALLPIALKVAVYESEEWRALVERAARDLAVDRTICDPKVLPQ